METAMKTAMDSYGNSSPSPLHSLLQKGYSEFSLYFKHISIGDYMEIIRFKIILQPALYA